MREIGKVVSASGGRALVEVQRGAACASCGKCDGHIVFGDKKLVVEAAYVGSVSQGDYVELELPDTDFVRISFLLYLLPIISTGVGYAAGFFLGRSLGMGPMFGVVFAAFGLGASFIWLKHYDAKTTKEGRYLPLARPLKDFENY